MPAILVALASVLGTLLTNLIIRIIATFGIGYVTYIGLRPFYDYVSNEVRRYMVINNPSGMPIVEWLGVLKFDVCISIMLSAVTMKLLLKGLDASGHLKTMRIK